MEKRQSGSGYSSRRASGVLDFPALPKSTPEESIAGRTFEPSIFGARRLLRRHGRRDATARAALEQIGAEGLCDAWQRLAGSVASSVAVVAESRQHLCVETVGADEGCGPLDNGKRLASASAARPSRSQSSGVR